MIYAHAAQQIGMKYTIDCDREELEAVFDLLTAPDSDYINGSSFMVTSEPHDGRMRVYMSEASHRRFLEAMKDQQIERQLWKGSDGGHGC